ncbi:C4-dicarboxylate TRAP transporter large permease protein DctM [subsurface metagenome]
MVYGLVAAGGTLGMLIPPSGSMILYGAVTGESVGKLFMAGLVPGIILATLFAITVIILCKKSGKYEKLPSTSWKEKLQATKGALWIIMLPVIILGGIYSGIFTATEAAAASIIYALVVCLVTGTIKWHDLPRIFSTGTRTVALVTMIIIGAVTLAQLITIMQVAQNLCAMVVGSGIPSWAFIVAILCSFLVLGLFLDTPAICLLVIPIIAPILSMMGFSLIWFAVLFTIAMEIADLTPPVGLNLYVIQQMSGARLMDVIRGVIIFIGVMLIVLVIVALIPQLSTWLPGTM